MISHLAAMVLLAVQPLVFRTTDRLPHETSGPGLGGSLPLIAAQDGGFVALSDRTLVKLDAGGHTLLRSSFPTPLNVSAESLWPLGGDVLVGTTASPAWVVDGETLAMRPLPATFSYPAVLASNGSTILVLESATRATLLDRDGAVVTPPKSLIVPPPPIGAGAAATDGDGYLVVWNDLSILKNVHVDGTGFVRAINDFWIFDVPKHYPDAPRIAFGGGKYLIVWQDGNRLYARLAAADGHGAADAVVLDTSFAAADSVVWDGTAFLVTFGSRIARIGADGKLVETRQLDAAPGSTVQRAAVAVNGQAVIVVQQEICPCGDCAGLRAGPLGGPLTPFAAGESEGSTEAAVVAATEQAAVVAYESRTDAARLRIAFVPQRGQPIAVPSQRGSQSQPAIATDGETFLVAWLERDDQCLWQVVAAVMDANGRFGPMVQLSDDEVTFSPPAVAWNGSEYAVVWKRRSSLQIAGVRVTRFGRPLGAPIDLTAGPKEAYTPSIAWAGDGYVVGWVETTYRSSPPYAVSEYHVHEIGADLRPTVFQEWFVAGDAGKIVWNGTKAVLFMRFGSQLAMIRLPERVSSLVPILIPTFAEPSVAWRNGEWLVTGIGPTGARIARVTDDAKVLEDLDVMDGDEIVPLFAARVAATPTRVIVTVESFNPPRTVTIRTTDPPRPRPRVVR